MLLNVKNKSTDQLMHQRSLISAFIFLSLLSILQDMHIDSIMTFLRHINLFKQNQIAIFKIMFCFT